VDEEKKMSGGRSGVLII